MLWKERTKRKIGQNDECFNTGPRLHQYRYSCSNIEPIFKNPLGIVVRLRTTGTSREWIAYRFNTMMREGVSSLSIVHSSTLRRVDGRSNEGREGCFVYEGTLAWKGIASLDRRRALMLEDWSRTRRNERLFGCQRRRI